MKKVTRKKAKPKPVESGMLTMLMGNKKWIAVGAIALALITALGALASRVVVQSSLLSSQELELAEVKKADKEKSTQIQQLSQSTKSAESKYKKLTAAVNPITGEPLFDKNGNPLFDSDEGSSNQVEQLFSQINELQIENESLQDSVQRKQSIIAELKEKSSGPGFKSTHIGASWDAPLGGYLDGSQGRLGLGAGPNFLLGSMMLSPGVAFVFPRGMDFSGDKELKDGWMVRTDLDLHF